MAVRTFQRKELKFMITTEQYKALLPTLLEHMNYDKHCTNGGYSIYNIYYDTVGNDIIRNSVAKPKYKEKLRLRSYEVPKGLDNKVYLELKKKINGVVSKRRATVTLKEAYDFVEKGIKPSAQKYLDKQVIEEIAYHISQHKLIPALFLSYDRVALVGKEDKNFRLTLDNNIQTRRYDLKLERGAYGEQLLEKDRYIMEVKVVGGMPLWLAHEFTKLKISRISFSKYGTEFKKHIKLQKSNIAEHTA